MIVLHLSCYTYERCFSIRKYIRSVWRGNSDWLRPIFDIREARICREIYPAESFPNVGNIVRIQTKIILPIDFRLWE